ncbi:GTPBP1 [Cordylochernes scorpioides]|uniref:Mitochondrial inner membrane protease ATP23 n=1 Tax=Cordylochernes scorpioides TaxID=51811 RepID=A0ABY6KCL4_9ARAC|nr:GTPBP1 [Cordylochernes scorpioides]
MLAGSLELDLNQRPKDPVVTSTVGTRGTDHDNHDALIGVLLKALEEKGCPVDISRHFSCEMCSEAVMGGYDPETNQAVVCQNTAGRFGHYTTGVLSHELIHMYDHCRAKVDFNNLDHLACTEIRAANLMHCSLASSIMDRTSNPIQFRNTHRVRLQHLFLPLFLNPLFADRPLHHGCVLSHELIHMYDHCRAKVDFNNLDHLACTEIRAANLMHCSLASSIMDRTSNPIQFRNTHRVRLQHLFLPLFLNPLCMCRPDVFPVSMVYSIPLRCDRRISNNSVVQKSVIFRNR